MKCTEHIFPSIKILEYRSPAYDGPCYHLYINGDYQGMYMNDDDLMKRLSLLIHNELKAGE